MPSRNLRFILIVSFLCCLCVSRTSRYDRVLDFIRSEMLNRGLEPTTEKELFEGAVRGMTAELDYHTGYISSDDLAQFEELIDNEFCGIGVHIIEEEDPSRLVVLCPIFESPAYAAGVRAGDEILEVNGHRVQDSPISEANELIRGEKGTSVALLVRHRNDETEEVTVVRDVIYSGTLHGDRLYPDGSNEYLLESELDIAYVWIDSVTDRTSSEFRDALTKLLTEGMQGLILDLRDNPGGSLGDAALVCDLFVTEGDIVTTRYRDGTIKTQFTAVEEGTFPEFPVAVLIDGMSASAAEIIAACLQDHNRAVVIGERSFGKGTVQELIYLQDDLGLLKLTTAGYWRPSGRNIHRGLDATEEDEWGVTPDEGYRFDLSPEERTAVFMRRLQRSQIPVGFEDELSLFPTGEEPESDVDEVETTEEDANNAESETTPESIPEENETEDRELLKAIEYLRDQIKAAQQP